MIMKVIMIMKEKHSTNISSITIKQDEIITTDLAGFVKFWNI